MNPRCIGIGLLSVIILVGFLTSTALATQSKLEIFKEIKVKQHRTVQYNIASLATTSSVIIQNEYLKIEVGNNGQYRGWTSDGNAIFYPYGDYPWSSFITIKVNGNLYSNAPWSSNLDNYITQETIKLSPIEAETKWYIPEEKLEITQDIILVGEQAKFILKLKNKGSSDITVSVRYLWDTQIADNDGAPLREEGGDLHEFEIAFEPVTFSYWSAYARPEPGSLVIYATWDTIPSKIIFAHWPEAYQTLWDYPWDPNRRFYTPGYTTFPESDSCVLMYWKDIVIHPNEERKIVTYYGSTVGGGVKVNVSTDKYYYLTGENITILTRVTDANGSPLYPLQKNNFKAFIDGNNVSILSFRNVNCADYELKVSAPQTIGTHSIMVKVETNTGWGSDTIGVKVYNITKVSLAISGNRLTLYENSAETPIYYRNDSKVYPVFYVSIDTDGATLSEVKDYINVFVYINDYSKANETIIKRATYDPNKSLYMVNWISPKNYPIGKYNATAVVKVNGREILKSKVRYFYLIFKPPKGLENFVYYTCSADITGESPAPDPTPGASFEGTKFYSLHQFEYRNWKNTLDFLTGPNKFGWDSYPAIYTERQAIERLMTFAHGIDIGGSVDDSYYGYWHMDDNESKRFSDIYNGWHDYPALIGTTYKSTNTHIHGDYIYGTFGTSKDYPAADGWPPWEEQNAWWYDVDKFKDSNFNPENKNLPHNRPTGVCVDYAALLISHARSAGIPARQIGGFFAGGGGHSVTEVYYNGKWHHVDPTWNEMERPWTYSYQGYYWTSYKTSSKSPWNVVNGRKIDVIDRKDYYNYLVKITDIKFDKSDYSYPDTVTVEITVKNIGHIPINKDRLHLKLIDHPTVTVIGVDNLIVDFKIPYQDIQNPGSGHTYTFAYRLPDYGPLNWFYKHAPGFDRYLIAQIEYYNRKYEPFVIDKVEKKVPGLCVEYSPELRIDDSGVILNTANMTKLLFNETANESTETFEKPINASVIVKHKIKSYDKYTREIWYIFNPDNRIHKYSLTLPLLGVGDAVYIPGYGVISINTSLNVSTSYIVIYNTTAESNGSVDIYAFSQNMTITNVTIFNGFVKITGTWSTSLVQKSGISYMLYSSTRDVGGLSFDELYTSFAEDIINNGDTLTHFYIQGENKQISCYNIGDTVYVNVKLHNNGILPEVRTLKLTITEPGPWNSEIPVYNETKTITIPAGGVAITTFQYQIPENPYIGKHRIVISDDIAKATTIFIVGAPFNVTFEMPSNVTQSQDFYVNITITNELDRPLSDVTVTIDLPNDFNTSENLTKFVGTLLSGESAKVSWLVTATDFEYGYSPFTFYISSAEGIRHIVSAYTNVLRLPELKIYPSAPSKVRVNDSFVLKVNITNKGDVGISNVYVHITLPNNVTTSDNLTKSIGNLAGGETKTISWIIVSKCNEDYWINIEAYDANRKYYTNSTVFINVIRPKISVDIIAPSEVLVGESFPVVVKIKNVGDGIANNVSVKLEYPPEFETTDNTLGVIGNLTPNEEKEIIWTLKGIRAGYGDIIASVSDSNVSVSKGIIVTHFSLTVKTDKDVYSQGEVVMIKANVTNENPEVSYVDLRMNVTIQGNGITEKFSRPILYISRLETQEVTFSWDTTGKPIGEYTITAKLIETPNLRVLTEASTSFTIKVVKKLIATPDHLKILAGGNGTTNITIYLEEGDGIGQTHTIIIQFYNRTTNQPTDKLTGTLSSDEVTLTKVESDEVGVLYYTWTPLDPGSYKFKLTLELNESVTVGEKFKIVVIDAYGTEQDVVEITADSIVYVEAIPEKCVFLLVTIGLALISFTRRGLL